MSLVDGLDSKKMRANSMKDVETEGIDVPRLR